MPTEKSPLCQEGYFELGPVEKQLPFLDLPKSRM